MFFIIYNAKSKKVDAIINWIYVVTPKIPAYRAIFGYTLKKSGLPIIEIRGKIAPIPIASNIAPIIIAAIIITHFLNCFRLKMLNILNIKSIYYSPYLSHHLQYFNPHLCFLFILINLFIILINLNFFNILFINNITKYLILSISSYLKT